MTGLFGRFPCFHHSRPPNLFSGRFQVQRLPDMREVKEGMERRRSVQKEEEFGSSGEGKTRKRGEEQKITGRGGLEHSRYEPGVSGTYV